MSVGYSIPLGLALRFSPEVLGADMAPDAPMQFFGIERNGRMVATSLLYLADGLAGNFTAWRPYPTSAARDSRRM